MPRDLNIIKDNSNKIKIAFYKDETQIFITENYKTSSLKLNKEDLIKINNKINSVILKMEEK